MSRDGEDYLSLSDDHNGSPKGYISEDDLDSDLDEVLARIFDDDCDNDKNCEMENLLIRTSCGKNCRNLVYLFLPKQVNTYYLTHFLSIPAFHKVLFNGSFAILLQTIFACRFASKFRKQHIKKHISMFFNQPINTK